MVRRFHPKYVVFLSLILAILSCSAPVNPFTPTPVALSFLLVTANPNATRTSTPFQPVTSTPRPTNLPRPTATLVVQPTSQPTLIPTVRPVTNPSRYPDGQVRIMVFGSDARPGEGGYRTDIMMMVSINPKTGTASVLSFPRDLWVNIPGWGMNRINTAMAFGGFPLLASTLESNFGIRPNYYVTTNFSNFTSIIDGLGGVDVIASISLTDRCKFPEWKPDGITCVVNAGKTHMNGTQALWYVRSRHTTSDFDRERRSQEVLQAIFHKLISVDSVPRIPTLYDFYRKNVETNLTVDQAVALAPVGIQLLLDPNRVRRFSIGSAEVTDFTTENGWMVLLPNDAAIYNIILKAVFTP
jgi:LCP family protein required for cell wall assembly